MRIISYLSFLKKVSIIDFFYLNYFCKSVIRTDRCKVIPYRHAVVEISKTARIYVGGGDIEIGCDSLKRSREETRIRLRKNAVWASEGGCKMSYGTTLEVLENAVFCSRYFTVNSGSAIVAGKKITLGEDVMIGRNAVVYDSDFHRILQKDETVMNPSRPVKIGDHVWLGANAMILKGTVIGNNSVIGANTVVSGSVPENSICHTRRENGIKDDFETWNRRFV